MVGRVSVDAAVDSSAEHTQAGPDSHTELNIHILFMPYLIYAHTQTNLQKLTQAPIHILCSIYIYYFYY